MSGFVLAFAQRGWYVAFTVEHRDDFNESWKRPIENL